MGKLYPLPENPDEWLKRGLGLGLFGVGPPEGFQGKNSSLYFGHWDHIVELLEDNEEPAPEDEFLTNTKGHIQGANYRLAVVDAVIGLEIVLTRYIETYLSVVKHLPEWRIKKFLRTELGLTARLSGMLDLMLHESYLKDIEINVALKVVDWRNSIVHKTGRLPGDIVVEDIVPALNAVLKLARTLGEIQRDIGNTPLKYELIQKLATHHSNIVFPKIWFQARHGVLIVLEFFFPYPEKEDMERIAIMMADMIKTQDRRFNPSVNLEVIFETSDEKRLGAYSMGMFYEPGKSPREIINKVMNEKQPEQHDMN